MRRRLGLCVTFDDPDPFGHARVATCTGGRTHARYTAVGPQQYLKGTGAHVYICVCCVFNRTPTYIKKHMFFYVFYMF